MKYSWEQGVEKHPEGLSRSLIVGLPVVFAALILGPMKLGYSPTHPPKPTAHNTAAALRQPFNLRSSGNTNAGTSFSSPSGQTTAYGTYSSSTNNSASPASSASGADSGAASPSSSGSSTPGTAPTSTVTTGGMGGGSGSTSSTGSASSGPIPTTGVSVPATSLSVDSKPIVSTSGLTLTVN